MTKVAADASSKGIRCVEKGVHLEGPGEHADVLEVNDADTSRCNVVDVVKEVVLADIGMTDDEIVWQRDWRWFHPQSDITVRHSLSVLLATQIAPLPSTTLVMQFLLAMSSWVRWLTLKRQSDITVRHSLSVLLATRIAPLPSTIRWVSAWGEKCFNKEP